MRMLLAMSLLFAAVVSCTHQRPAGVASRSAEVSEEVLILVSLDGFRWDYMDWPEAAHVRALAAHGVCAQGLIPVFPSKTFPSHYTTVTGLHPGHHGIVSNHMIDPTLGSEFHLADRSSVEDTRWWGGEPIWVTAEKAGQVAAAMFWPGTETEIAGIRPTYWHRWDESFAYGARVDRRLGDLRTGPRVTPIIGVPDVGWEVATRDWLQHHGHDMITVKTPPIRGCTASLSRPAPRFGPAW
jgi:predicted AlkP superfamily pyrophosphatase or phosphodiesterase